MELTKSCEWVLLTLVGQKAKRGPFFSYSELGETAPTFEFAALAVMNS